MKVILLKNIEKLGRKGDIKDVSNGYARNFLLPKDMAVLATDDELEKLDGMKEFKIQQQEEDLLKCQDMAEQMDGLEIEIKARASEDGKLFGAISQSAISSKLNDLGFEIKEKEVKLNEPIKETGEYDIKLELPHNLEVNLKVIVIQDDKKK